jgi:hypothetical protein
VCLYRPAAERWLSVGLMGIRARRPQSRNLDCELNLPEIGSETNAKTYHAGRLRIYSLVTGHTS